MQRMNLNPISVVYAHSEHCLKVKLNQLMRSKG